MTIGKIFKLSDAMKSEVLFEVKAMVTA